jgi:hypothetical protein
MQPSKALTIVTRSIHHVCPYKGQTTPIALCYMKAQDIEERELCYGCDYVERLKEKFGLRTFRRTLIIARCKHCDDAAIVHEVAPPYRNPTIAFCPGFEPEEDSGWQYVPTSVDCTQWMVVNVVTGERKPFYRDDRLVRGDRKRYHLPLIGAPGTVPSDGFDEARLEAAASAERARNSRERQNESDELTATKKRGSKQKKEETK